MQSTREVKDLEALEAQPYLYPTGYFTPEQPPADSFWTCVRTKPRWEKKLARWLEKERLTYYLPTLRRQVTSHRKTRVTDLPLFPGYLFIQGNLDKRDLVRSESVVTVVKPSGPSQAQKLHHELWSIWKSLTTGSGLELVRKLEPGQWVEVTAGPLKGIRGQFEKWGKGHRLVLGVDMLGVGVAVEVPDTCTVVPLD